MWLGGRGSETGRTRKTRHLLMKKATTNTKPVEGTTKEVTLVQHGVRRFADCRSAGHLTGDEVEPHDGDLCGGRVVEPPGVEVGQWDRGQPVHPEQQEGGGGGGGGLEEGVGGAAAVECEDEHDESRKEGVLEDIPAESRQPVDLVADTRTHSSMSDHTYQIQERARRATDPSIDPRDELEVFGLDRPLSDHKDGEGGGDVAERDKEEERREEGQDRLDLEGLLCRDRQGVVARHEGLELVTRTALVVQSRQLACVMGVMRVRVAEGPRSS